MARDVGITARVARNRTRLLRSDVTGRPLYAFGGTQGGVCFFMWRGGGACGPVTATHNVISVLDHGSRTRGQVVFGVVSDRVRAVDVSIRGRTTRAPIVNNTFFVPFRIGQYEVMPRPQVRPIIR